MNRREILHTLAEIAPWHAPVSILLGFLCDNPQIVSTPGTGLLVLVTTAAWLAVPFIAIKWEVTSPLRYLPLWLAVATSTLLGLDAAGSWLMQPKPVSNFI